MYKIDFNRPISVYFVGIGGISMSGLAELLIAKGFKVSGSDMQESPLTEALRAKGAIICCPQKKENIKDGIDLAVYTAAIREDNPELMEIHGRNIPTLSRSELLGQVMDNYSDSLAVAGTHGKTTTTGMLSHILLSASLDPTISIGGILPSIQGNFRVGKSPCFLTEACEYKNSFLDFRPKVGVILNVEADHLDFFKDIDDIRHSFRRFAENIRAAGTLIIHNNIAGYSELTDGLPCRVVHFGLDDTASYHAENISYDNGLPRFDLYNGDKLLGQLELHVPGGHNIENAIAAAAAADAMGIDTAHILEGLGSFKGTGRRFEHKGQWNGIDIIDDYAHHPTEIKATLEAARKSAKGKIWCVFQPHTYSRTKALLDNFADALKSADEVIVADIYAAREKDPGDIHSRDLKDAIIEKGGHAHYFPSFKEIIIFLSEQCIHGDMLITMGAGDIYKVGDELLSL